MARADVHWFISSFQSTLEIVRLLGGEYEWMLVDGVHVWPRVWKLVLNGCVLTMARLVSAFPAIRDLRLRRIIVVAPNFIEHPSWSKLSYFEGDTDVWKSLSLTCNIRELNFQENIHLYDVHKSLPDIFRHFAPTSITISLENPENISFYTVLAQTIPQVEYLRVILKDTLNEAMFKNILVRTSTIPYKILISSRPLRGRLLKVSRDLEFNTFLFAADMICTMYMITPATPWSISL